MEPSTRVYFSPLPEGYTFVAKVTTRPEVTLGEYKGLEAVREDSAVTEEEVQSELDRRR